MEVAKRAAVQRTLEIVSQQANTAASTKTAWDAERAKIAVRVSVCFLHFVNGVSVSAFCADYWRGWVCEAASFCGSGGWRGRCCGGGVLGVIASRTVPNRAAPIPRGNRQDTIAHSLIVISIHHLRQSSCLVPVTNAHPATLVHVADPLPHSSVRRNLCAR